MEIRKSYKDFDLAFVDTETTGVALDHELLEIGVVRVNPFNFSVIDEWEAKIKPFNLANADPEAFKINGYNEEDWKNAISEEEAMKKFLEKTEGTMLCGHNIVFDWYYIHKALLRYKLSPTFFYKSLDTFAMAWTKLRNETSLKAFSLKELSLYYGINQDKPHTALDDAKTTYKVFLELIKSGNEK
jgi:DNA polymerase III epsilon subunit-like protein